MCSEAGSEGGAEGCAKVGIINISMPFRLRDISVNGNDLE